MNLRKLDALVAEKVMGWKDISGPDHGIDMWQTPEGHRGIRGKDIPSYSTDIAAAWEVAEKLSQLCFGLWRVGDEWECELDSNDGRFLVAGDSVHVFGSGISAPLAICLAALKAVGVSEDEIKRACE